jgi:hypothetical protein
MLQTSTPPASELQRSVTLLVKALSTTEAGLGRPGRGGAVGVSCISIPGVLEGRHGEATLNGAEGGSAHPPMPANPRAVSATAVAISLRPWPVEESKNAKETQWTTREGRLCCQGGIRYVECSRRGLLQDGRYRLGARQEGASVALPDVLPL